MEEIFFKSEYLLVKKVGNFSGKVLVITFDSFNDLYTVDRSGFGEHYFSKNEIDAVHFLSKDNLWYQHHEMNDLLEKVALYAQNYEKVFTYGSSMGGYAAIRHAKQLNAQAIAFSPQYSIDLRVVPDEKRWIQHSKKIQFIIEKQKPIARNEHYKAIIFYDPMEKEDEKHVRRIAEDTDIINIPMPYAGHVSIVFLMEIGILDKVILSIIHDKLDVNFILSEVHSKRKTSARYYETLAQHAQYKHPLLACSIMEKAVNLPQAGHGTKYIYACILKNNKFYDRSIKLIREVIENQPDNLAYRKNLSLTLLEIKRSSDARIELFHLLERYPEKSIIYRYISISYLQENNFKEAVHYEKKAIESSHQRLYKNILHKMMAPYLNIIFTKIKYSSNPPL